MPPASVSLAATHELLPALRLLFVRRGDDGIAAESLRDELLASDRESLGLFATRDDTGRVRGAMLVQALPGALGVAWPPRAETPEMEDALVAAACDWLRARGVKVCQVFPTVAELPDTAALARNGFGHVTRLAIMKCDLSPHPPVALPSAFSLSFIPATASPLSDEFRETLLATHEGTRDCPELNGSRTADELLADFLDPPPLAKWYLARDPGGPVGVLMLAPATAWVAVEVTYVGVVPSARGRGFGAELLKFGMSEAVRGGALAMTVSVDARNEPALRLYRRHGFAEVERRVVLLTHFPGL